MPLDERTYAPVPRHKYLLRPSGVPPPPHWIPPRPDSDPEVAKFSKLRDENHHYRLVLGTFWLLIWGCH